MAKFTWRVETGGIHYVKMGNLDMDIARVRKVDFNSTGVLLLLGPINRRKTAEVVLDHDDLGKARKYAEEWLKNCVAELVRID